MQARYLINSLIKLMGLIVTLTIVLMLSGCATPSCSERMCVGRTDLQQEFISKKPCPYNRNICMGTVDGGKETNPMWVSTVNNKEFKNALETSLRNVEFYNSDGNARYLLNAKLEKLNQPLVGLDMTVTCQSHYEIYDQKLKKIVFEKTITTPYTAKFSSALLGSERLKSANEGAVKENIKDLFTSLYSS